MLVKDLIVELQKHDPEIVERHHERNRRAMNGKLENLFKGSDDEAHPVVQLFSAAEVDQLDRESLEYLRRMLGDDGFTFN